MNRRFVLGAIALVACTRSAADPVKVPPPPIAASADTGATATAAATSDAGGEAAPTSTWRSTPVEKDGLFVAIDGLCTNLFVVPAGTGAAVTYGGEWTTNHYDGPPTKRLGTGTLGALGDVLDVRGAIGVTRLSGAYGAASGDVWAFDDTRTRADGGSGDVSAHHYAPGVGWNSKSDPSRRDLEAPPAEWTSGSVLAYTRAHATKVTFWSTKPDADVPPDVPLPDAMKWVAGTSWPWDRGLASVDADAKSGTVVLALSWYANEGGSGDNKPITKLRSWQKARGWKDMPGTSWPSWVDHVVVGSETDVSAQSDRAVFHFDGKAWKKVIDESVKAEAIQKRPRGGVATLGNDGKIRFVDGAGVVTVLAGPEPFESYAFAGDRVAATGKSGKLYEKKDTSWAARALPSPAFGTNKDPKARLVRMGADGSLYVVAKYWEKGGPAHGWTESELHWMLVTTKKTRETYRCNEPDPENNNYHVGIGFQSWPPLADGTCKTPFVVVARKSNAKKESGFGALAKKLATPGNAFVELTSGDRTFLGAKADDFAAAEALAEKATPLRLRPEIVCGEPDKAVALVP